MRVKMLRSPSFRLGFPEECVEGATLDLDDKQAEKLIAAKLAEPSVLKAVPKAVEIQASTEDPVPAKKSNK